MRRRVAHVPIIIVLLMWSIACNAIWENAERRMGHLIVLSGGLACRLGGVVLCGAQDASETGVGERADCEAALVGAMPGELQPRGNRVCAIPLYYGDLSVERVVLAGSRGLLIRLQRGFCCSRGVYEAVGRVSGATGVFMRLLAGFWLQQGAC